MISPCSRHGFRLVKKVRLKSIKRATSDGSAHGVNLTNTASHMVHPLGSVTMYSGCRASCRARLLEIKRREALSEMPISVYRTLKDALVPDFRGDSTYR